MPVSRKELEQNVMNCENSCIVWTRICDSGELETVVELTEAERNFVTRSWVIADRYGNLSNNWEVADQYGSNPVSTNSILSPSSSSTISPLSGGGRSSGLLSTQSSADNLGTVSYSFKDPFKIAIACGLYLPILIYSLKFVFLNKCTVDLQSTDGSEAGAITIGNSLLEILHLSNESSFNINISNVNKLVALSNTCELKDKILIALLLNITYILGMCGTGTIVDSCLKSPICDRIRQTRLLQIGNRVMDTLRRKNARDVSISIEEAEELGFLNED